MRFGPYTGRIVSVEEVNRRKAFENEFLWEVCNLNSSSWFSITFKWQSLSDKDMVKLAAKTCNFCCAFYPRLSCNKSGCSKLRQYWLLIGWNYSGVKSYTWVASLVAKQVYLEPEERATWIDSVLKVELLSSFCKSFGNRFKLWVVKRATSLLNSFCNNVTKQIACFCCRFTLH